MAEIFSCLWEGAPGLIGQRLEDFGVSARDKVSPMSDLDLGKIYGQVAKALGNRKTALYVRADEGASDDVNIVVQAPPALVVGPALAADAQAARRSASSSDAASSCPARVHPGRRRPAQAVHDAVRQRAARLPPAPRAPARRDGRRRRRAGRQAEEERPLQGVEAAGRAVRRAGNDVLELAALAGRRPPRRQPHRPACCAATSGPRPPSSSRRAPRSRTATGRAPRTCAGSPPATSRCASCCASRSARTTSCCAKRSAPRSRRSRRVTRTRREAVHRSGAAMQPDRGVSHPPRVPAWLAQRPG